ncbi:hypothetical protein LOK49_LG04G00570 [Camellia lanceoleosa]|uniref:Uncharacterized protein n=1 Tax=Camellia lanceoleosa TaxID=1840588 RepID=A0ACC0I1D5_9ERIC|nr:hypothetical protein LOK49_LG04G00570 [Camellia lanceoleosa]
MKKAQESNKTKHTFIPNAVKQQDQSCLKIVSSNVRSAGASVAGSISGAPDDLHNSASLTSAACWVVRCYLLHGNLGWIHRHALNLWCFYDFTACAAQQGENNQLKQ